MDHVAILCPKIKMLEKILSGEKTIESRWYKNKIAPWNRIAKNDVVYFKDSSKLITAKAIVEKVMQFSELDIKKIKKIINQYYKQIGIDIKNVDYTNYLNKNYCILVFIKNVKQIKPFNINKKGFGNACAWLCISDIDNIKII